MTVVVLAGGRGTRLAGDADGPPKPLVEIGGRPILWHVLMHYARYGFRRFVVALGYRGDDVRRFFDSHGHGLPRSCDVQLVDTGTDTATGGRLRRLADRVGVGTFMMTWTDGLADVDLIGLLAFHRAHGRLATMTAVRPPTRFGHLAFDGDRVTSFVEKPPHGEGWISGAFFVLEPAVLEYIDGDGTPWEQDPLRRLAADGQLMGFRHESFWQCMDTEQDRKLLQAQWNQGQGRAPWNPAE